MIPFTLIRKDERMNPIVRYAVDQITTLCKIPSPTGFTHRVQDYLMGELAALGYAPIKNNKGGVLVHLGGSGRGLMLAAHVDTLGLMVRAVKPNGRLRFTKIGGYPANYIETENCTVFTREGKTYSATVQLNNPGSHLRTDIPDTKRDDATMEIVLDERVKTRADVQALGIAAGDFIALDPRTVVTGSGYIKSRHLDDKASSGVLLALARAVKAGDVALARSVWLLFTTYEEVGHGGSGGHPDGIEEFLSVDMGVVGEDLGTDEHTVSICAKDSAGPYDYDVTTALVNLAKAHKLNYAVDIYPYYSSDAQVAVRSGGDYRHALIGPGVSASHGYERTHVEGVENTYRLLAAYVQQA